MNTAAHSLSASITSALALKPSTVYILRVENAQTRQSWHIRRCFSEFCELREKLLSLIDDQMAAYLTSLESDGCKHSSSISTSNLTSSSSPVSSISSRYGKHHRHHSASPALDRFAYVFKQFPHRRLFRSRSKRVIEARSLALNCFLQQTLEVVEVVRQRRLIAICFSMMTHIETFLECADHREVTRYGVPTNRSGTVSPTALRRTSAAVSLTRNFHHHPLVPTPAFNMTLTDQKFMSNTSRYHLSSSEEDESGARTNNGDDAQHFNNFNFTQRFYREFNRQDERDEIYGEDSDDEEEMELLKKTRSAMLESETRARKLYYSGSHISMLETGHIPAHLRARRIEIAGVHNAAMLKVPRAVRKISAPASYDAEQHPYDHQLKYPELRHEKPSDFL